MNIAKHAIELAKVRDHEVLGEKHLAVIRRELEAAGRDPGYNPLVEIAKVATDKSRVTRATAAGVLYETERVPPELAVRCHEVVASFVYPKLKQVEVSGPGGGPIPVEQNQVVLDIVALVEALVRKKEEP